MKYNKGLKRYLLQLIKILIIYTCVLTFKLTSQGKSFKIIVHFLLISPRNLVAVWTGGVQFIYLEDHK